ncbi:dephospho-CoA kinase [Leptotrichia sp. oral taxon 879]|uniref:dephospho-CoA kinase n=1 Tax=Leptotrichia sp. oral taxon 879 TaxID=1227267 RepID=UPI0003AE1853|nr:dephospho-CoA kinase [Leptotrichia sp. oral taxon 879]ERK48145.1 dephospho-CoA kinase [Leptotrichia sp. oral taxon 879 str. F0557]
MKKVVIGLTGGIGTGKSTVSQILKGKNFPVIDLDIISHEVIKFPKVVEKIVENFGKEVLEYNNTGNWIVSREKLGRVIFGNREKRLILNSVMHPEILRIMREKILECKKENKIIFVEIQLLFEVQWEKEFDYILLVSAEKETQIKRILARDNRSKEEALSIINSQMSLDEKKKRSDYVIENDGNIQDLEKKVDEFLKKIEFENILKPILN